VAIGESSGDNYRIAILQIMRFVPEKSHRLPRDVLNRPEGIVIAIRTRKNDDAKFHARPLGRYFFQFSTITAGERQAFAERGVHAKYAFICMDWCYPQLLRLGLRCRGWWIIPGRECRRGSIAHGFPRVTFGPHS